MRILFGMVAALGISAGAATAKTTVYDCAINDRANTGWIPTQLIIAEDTGTGDILISDPIGYYYNDGKPLPGKIAVQNGKRITYAWTLKGVKNRAGQYAPNFSFRATYLKAGGKMSVTSKPLGYTNTFKGTGTCKVTSK